MVRPGVVLIGSLLVSALVGAAGCGGTGGQGLAGENLESLTARASPFQQALVADGDLTIDELLQAATRAVECMEEHSLEVTERPHLVDNPQNPVDYAVRVPVGVDVVAGEAIIEECQRLYFRELNTAYGILHRP